MKLTTTAGQLVDSGTGRLANDLLSFRMRKSAGQFKANMFSGEEVNEVSLQFAVAISHRAGH